MPGLLLLALLLLVPDASIATNGKLGQPAVQTGRESDRHETPTSTCDPKLIALYDTAEMVDPEERALQLAVTVKSERAASAAKVLLKKLYPSGHPAPVRSMLYLLDWDQVAESSPLIKGR